LEPGTHSDYEVHGRKRLATLRPIKLTKLSTPAVEAWLAHSVDEGRYAPSVENHPASIGGPESELGKGAQ
jgi:hypothetical protein